MADIVNYYTTIYDEESRLGEKCDNRHLVEREVKINILNKFIKEQFEILEIGAGTGLYSLYFARKGNKVSACDIVPDHIDKINTKADKHKVKINACVANSLSLPYKDESFDVVLLSGPIYHLNDFKDKEKSIKEAARVCKRKGIVVVDYLSDIHGFIQHCLLDSEFIKEASIQDIENKNCKDEMFSYDNTKKILNIMKNSGLENIKFYGTDSITRFIREDINKFDELTISKWIKFISSISDNLGTIEMSEHCLAIGTKK